MFLKISYADPGEQQLSIGARALMSVIVLFLLIMAGASIAPATALGSVGIVLFAAIGLIAVNALVERILRSGKLQNRKIVLFF